MTTPAEAHAQGRTDRTAAFLTGHPHQCYRPQDFRRRTGARAAYQDGFNGVPFRDPAPRRRKTRRSARRRAA